MLLNTLRKNISFIIFLGCSMMYSQRFGANGGLMMKVEITLGNQNQWLKLGIFSFGTLNYGDMSVESGISFASYPFLKRHTVKTQGLAYSYEFFALGGIGKNDNLLGSSLSEINTTILFNSKEKSGFNGIGFGFSKEYLPKILKSYGLRRGALLMRFSNANHSIHVAFYNDFKIGWFHGAGTDYGVTGTLNIGFTRIQNDNTIHQFGIGIDLFTARPDYSLSPRNPINSDDGRKNVWYTLPPLKELFYGNVYAFATYQENNFSVHSKLGINSQKAGAYIQNILHDGLGLNPRFPWQVETRDKMYIEVSANTFIKKITND
ncbi:hypothetical protein [Aquimarina sp. RZ0]|uniref:hypothetical protein n=1 Tax=Aquimarina sp. RZ0 TaxID=2607730 RepID=UPI0011F30AFD|nr:hypothetical protein [Aquimarina sp. RZ0]KAA1246971.1 hypothetical protein F0000_05800 [Aquimarina sp. RZ0]